MPILEVAGVFLGIVILAVFLVPIGLGFIYLGVAIMGILSNVGILVNKHAIKSKIPRR